MTTPVTNGSLRPSRCCARTGRAVERRPYTEWTHGRRDRPVLPGHRGKRHRVAGLDAVTAGRAGVAAIGPDGVPRHRGCDAAGDPCIWIDPGMAMDRAVRRRGPAGRDR